MALDRKTAQEIWEQLADNRYSVNLRQSYPRAAGDPAVFEVEVMTKALTRHGIEDVLRLAEKNGAAISISARCAEPCLVVS